MLRHIVALLGALAIQAEQAAGRSFPVRWLVLAILRRGEIAACGYLGAVTRCEWSWRENPAEFRCDPADAMLLAARLRMLAGLLASLLFAAGGYSGRRRRIHGRHRLKLHTVRPAVIRAGQAARPNDTS